MEPAQLQYEMSRENIAMITRKCHDMKHQIEALIQTESHSERRKSFIEDVQDMIQVYDSDVHTGNEALDTILMEKAFTARSITSTGPAWQTENCWNLWMW